MVTLTPIQKFTTKLVRYSHAPSSPSPLPSPSRTSSLTGVLLMPVVDFVALSVELDRDNAFSPLVEDQHRLSARRRRWRCQYVEHSSKEREYAKCKGLL